MQSSRFKRWFRQTVAVISTAACALAQAQTVTYYHNDVSGSPIVATDASGNVLWKENYRPYGEKVNHQSNNLPNGSLNKIGFHGKPFDDNTGLSYMQARYYDPVLGRFTGIDPVGVDEDNLHSFNRYTYANNNPYKYVDPDGRVPVVVIPLVASLVEAGLITVARIGLARATTYVMANAARIGVATTEVAAGEALGGVSLAGGAAVASKVGSEVSAASRGSKSVAEAAGDLAKDIGHNRVSARTAGGQQVDIDLAGKGHFDKATGKMIETPHVHTSNLNVGPNGKTSASNTTVRPATMSDVRTAKKIEERK